jgi:hypothetical protein
MPRQDRLSWELGSALLEGWTGSVLLSSTLGPHKDSQGFGGLRCGFTNSAGNSNHTSGHFKHGPSAEVKCRGYMRALTAFSSEGRIRFVAADGVTELGSVRYIGNTGLVHIYTGTATLQATSVGVLTPNAYQRIEVHWFTAGGGLGFCRVYINDDGSHSTPFVEFNGTTSNGASTQVSRINIWHVRQMKQDDFAINTIGLRYDTGIGGLAAVGETVTDLGSLATGVVENIVNAGSSVGGFLILSQVTGTFVDGNPITTGGTFNAAVVAPTGDFAGGLMPQSDFPGDGVIVYMPPTGNGFNSDLLGDDGNSVDNYLRVDDLPIDVTGENVSSGTTTELDTYLTGTLPASAVVVKAFETVHSSQKDGTTINNARHALRLGGVDYTPVDSEYALPNDWETNIHTWDTNPDGSGAITVADVDAATTEPGFQVVT